MFYQYRNTEHTNTLTHKQQPMIGIGSHELPPARKPNIDDADSLVCNMCLLWHNIKMHAHKHARHLSDIAPGIGPAGLDSAHIQPVLEQCLHHVSYDVSYWKKDAISSRRCCVDRKRSEPCEMRTTHLLEFSVPSKPRARRCSCECICRTLGTVCLCLLWLCFSLPFRLGECTHLSDAHTFMSLYTGDILLLSICCHRLARKDSGQHRLDCRVQIVDVLIWSILRDFFPMNYGFGTSIPIKSFPINS